jgi:hypothetical protein
MAPLLAFSQLVTKLFSSCLFGKAFYLFLYSTLFYVACKITPQGDLRPDYNETRRRVKAKAMREAVGMNAMREDLAPADRKDNLYRYINIATDVVVHLQINFIEDFLYRIR